MYEPLEHQPASLMFRHQGTETAKDIYLTLQQLHFKGDGNVEPELVNRFSVDVKPFNGDTA